jgi:hypothetical protein
MKWSQQDLMEATGRIDIFYNTAIIFPTDDTGSSADTALY